MVELIVVDESIELEQLSFGVVALLPVLGDLIELAHTVAPEPPPRALLVELALVVENSVVRQFPTIGAHRPADHVFLGVGLLLLHAGRQVRRVGRPFGLLVF